MVFFVFFFLSPVVLMNSPSARLSNSISAPLLLFSCFFFSLQQFGKILDVEIIFNERGSKVSELEHQLLHYHVLLLFPNDGISVVCTLAESSGP